MLFSRSIVLFFLFVCLLVASLFYTGGRESLFCDDSRVVRAMLWKEHEGLWIRGGFIDSWDPTPEGCYRTREDYQALQALSWNEMRADFGNRRIYISQPNWGPLLLYPFWRASQLLAADHKDRLYIGVVTMHAITSLSTALALWLLCLWVMRETSVFSGLFVGLGMTLLPQMPLLLHTMGNSLLYKPFFHFLPFLLVAFALQSRWRKRSSTIVALGVVAALAFFSVIAKILFGLGYDMLLTVMIAATIPVFWYAVREGWSWRQFFLWFGVCGFAIIAGFAVAFVIHGLQTEAIGRDFFAHIEHRFLIRSYGFDPRSNTLSCEKLPLTIGEQIACKNRLTVVLESFFQQIPFLLFFAFCFLPVLVRADLKAHLKNPSFLALWRATLVCLGIGAVAAISQPLVWKQATDEHYWLSIFCWLLMFRPFALLALALLLEPTFLRGSTRAVRLWQQRVDASFRV